MTNAEKFLDIYNKIDRLLKDIDNENYQTFSSKIRNSKNPLIRNFKDKLLDFGELRNAIVHNPRIGNEFIAEPHKKVVDEFNFILDKLRNPKKVIPLFQFDVLGGQTNEKLDRMLNLMKENSFSQFPIFNKDNYVIELINTNTISRWLGGNIKNNEIITETPHIGDLIEHIEFGKNYKFISRNDNIYTAYDLFIKSIENDQRNLDCIFITNSGKENERLLGLITIEDIADKV